MRENATGYAASDPHAITQAGSESYCYDANGNVIRTSAGNRTITYTSYDLPSILTSGTNNIKVGFEHGPNREKIRRLNYLSTTATSSTDVVHYVGDAEIHLLSTRESRDFSSYQQVTENGRPPHRTRGTAASAQPSWRSVEWRDRTRKRPPDVDSRH